MAKNLASGMGRAGKNHDFFKKSKKNRIFLI